MKRSLTLMRAVLGGVALVVALVSRPQVAPAAPVSTPKPAAGTPITLHVDLTKAPSQNIAVTREVIPVKPGPLTLYYPKWIPGEHAPVGPIVNVADLILTGNGKVIAWRREPHDMFAFDLTVPPGVSALHVGFTYLGATFGRYSSARLATSNIAVITWNQSLFYPSTGTIQDTFFKPSITLPAAAWKYATALVGGIRRGDTVSFDTVSLEHLIDSPIDMGTHYRRWLLWQQGSAHAYLNVFADIPSELDVKPSVIGHYKKLVREMLAMYRARHWRNYNFLLTVSDVMPGEGIEHHESSDDGGPGDYLTNLKVLRRGGDLLSHEFNHSWDGKYRMPAGLYPPNLQMPYDDSLLWVYEGMTQYYGDVMSYRDGIRKAKSWPNHLAAIYAYYDNEPGRMWRPLVDTATSGPYLYYAPRGYANERRSAGDFYEEGELMWLRVDSIIRARTNGKKSLDTFAREFFGGKTTGPIVVTYTRNDIIAGLNKVLPYDWAGFFHKWVYSVASHPPDAFAVDGWKLVYTATPTHAVPKRNFWYSLGISNVRGTVADVKFGSPAWKAGLGINTRLVAVNGRAYSDNLLYDAIVAAKKTKTPISLLVEHTGAYRTIAIAYFSGPRYPHLVRIKGTPNRLSEVVKPYTK
ncbi:MAG: M61 family metallopeptidase [Vulcanimicrobiaceae bacterium]